MGIEDLWGGLQNAGSTAYNWLTNEKNGTTGIQDLLTIGGGAATAAGLFDSDPPKIGYQGKIPEYNAMQKLVPPNYDPNRMPGSYGQRYFTDIAYAGSPEEEAAADTALGNQQAVLQLGNAAQSHRYGPLLNNLGTRYSQNRAPLYEAPAGGIGDLPAGGINAAYEGPRTTRPADSMNKYPNQTPPNADVLAFYKMISENPEQWQAYVDSQMGGAAPTGNGGNLPPGARPVPGGGRLPAADAGDARRNDDDWLSLGGPQPTAPTQEVMDFYKMINDDPEGWMAYVNSQNSMAMGGMVNGPGDGMSDSIPAMIDGAQPAALATDEFVVPADVVSHIGNGSTNAGAKELMAMMARIRKARTGNPDQGKQINPNTFLPS